jgi:hypothetical protein
MKKIPIKRGQIWKHKHTGEIVHVQNKHDGSRWTLFCTKRKESHATTESTIYKYYEPFTQADAQELGIVPTYRTISYPLLYKLPEDVFVLLPRPWWIPLRLYTFIMKHLVQPYERSSHEN